MGAIALGFSCFSIVVFNCTDNPEPLYEKALQLRQHVLGEQHPDTLGSLNDLAVCLNSLGRTKEALPLIEKALQLRQQALGEQHPEALISLNNLAGCLHTLGRTKEALPLLEKALEFRQQTLGEQHPHTLSSLNNLAQCLNTLGRAKEALSLLEKALELRQQTLGEQHPHTLASLNNLAQCLNTLGRTKEALSLLEKALELRQQTLGEQHPHTLSSLNNLAQCLNDSGNNKKATLIIIQLLQTLPCCLQPGGETMKLLGEAVSYLAEPIKQGDFPDWLITFQQLDQALREILDLQDPRQLAASRKSVSTFYQTYLELCLEKRPDLVPEVFAGLQGRKLAALVLEEMESQPYPADSLHGQFMAVRCKLRELALGLQVYEGGKPDRMDDGFHGDRSMQRLQQQKNLWQAYEEGLQEYRQLQDELAASDKEFSVVTKILKPELATLQAGLTADSALVLLIQHQEGIVAFVVTSQATQTISLSEELLIACAPVNVTSSDKQGNDHYSRLSLDNEATGSSEHYDEWAQELIDVIMTQFFWEPIRSQLPTIRQVHLAPCVRIVVASNFKKEIKFEIRNEKI